MRSEFLPVPPYPSGAIFAIHFGRCAILSNNILIFIDALGILIPLLPYLGLGMKRLAG